MTALMQPAPAALTAPTAPTASAAPATSVEAAEVAVPAVPTKPSVRFPNLRSRLLLSGMFERQFIIPENPPRTLESLLLFIEKYLLRVDIREIRMDQPVFLLGLPRSGTTMLQDICCTHPNLAFITNAMHQFPRCFRAAEFMRRKLNLDAEGERYLGDSVEVAGGSPNEGIKFWADWFGWDPYNTHYVPRAPESFSAEEIDRIHTVMRQVIWCFGRPWRRFFSKNPALIPDIPILNTIFPDAKFVHIVRDPRNCANSMLKLYRLEQRQLEVIRSKSRHGIYDREEFIPYPRVAKLKSYLDEWGPDDIRTTANVWNDSISIVEEWKGRLKHFLEVRFEDILEAPKEQLDRIFDFCELPSVSPDNPKFREKIEGVGKTHHKNKYGDFELVEDICRGHMQTHGYV